jgi:hypothetical protein
LGSCHSGLYRDLPAIAAAPTDGGTTPVDGATGEPDAGPNLDAGPKPDASPNLDAGTTVVANPCQGRTGTASNVTLSDGTAVSCDGEWALVLKAAAASKEFAYDGGCWDPQHTQSSGCSVDTPFETAAAPEGRFPAYSRVLGTQIRIVMSDGNDRAFGSREFVYAAGAKTLGAAVMAGTYTGASPVDPWNYMTGAGSKLHSVLTEGVNVGADAYAQVRLGIVAAPAANAQPGSWLGVGGKLGSQCGGATTTTTVGNGYVATCTGQTSSKGMWVAADASVYVK